MIYNKKSILVLTTSFPVYEGIVAGIHVLEKCRELVKKGWDVQVIAPSHYKGKRQEKIDGINVRRFSYFFPEKMQKLTYGVGIPTNLKQSLLAKIQLPFLMLFFVWNTLIYSKKADVIHAHWFPAGLAGMAAKIIYKKPLFLMMHHPHKPNLLYRMILKKTDFLFSNSSYVLQRTDEIYKIKNKKILPVPIDYNKFQSKINTEHIRSKSGIPKGVVFILSAGRFIEWKGFEYLIQAIDILKNKYGREDIYLRIVGKGPLKNEYEDLIENSGLQPQVALTGYIPNDRINEYYSEADVFVIPSIVDKNGDTEGFGIVSLEANACQTPVIASRVGGIVDVIVDEYNGFLVDEKSPDQIAGKIMLLANNVNLRKQIGRNGRERVMNKFNWGNVAQDIIDAYDLMLNEY